MPNKDYSTRREVLKIAGATTIVGLAGCTGGDQNGSDDDGSQEGWTPTQNVRMIVPWGAGGGTDTAIRQIAQPAADILSDRGIDIELNVENITGAGGMNAATAVLNQPADGHTIFADTNVLAPNIARGTDAFTLEDWTGIARAQYDTTWIFSSGRSGAGFSDIYELVDKGQTDEVLFGISGGLDSAVFPIDFAKEAGFLENLEVVAYDDASRMENDVITGEIDCAYGELVELEPVVEAGDIELLYVGIDQTIEGYEDVPNVNDTGWDAQFGTKRAMVAPAGVPDEALEFWSELVRESMQTPEYQEFEAANYLNIREGYLPGPEYMEELADMVEMFRTALEEYDE